MPGFAVAPCVAADDCSCILNAVGALGAVVKREGWEGKARGSRLRLHRLRRKRDQPRIERNRVENDAIKGGRERITGRAPGQSRRKKLEGEKKGTPAHGKIRLLLSIISQEESVREICFFVYSACYAKQVPKGCMPKNCRNGILQQLLM